MRVRKIFPGPPHPAAHNVFKYVENALVKVAPFEQSCNSARAFLSQAIPALQQGCKFNLKVLNIDPPSSKVALAQDRKQSTVEVKLHDGSMHKFGTDMTASQMCTELKTHASLNGIEPKL